MANLRLSGLMLLIIDLLRLRVGGGLGLRFGDVSEIQSESATYGQKTLIFGICLGILV